MIRSELYEAIKSTAAEKFGKENVPDFSLQIPENREHGDYATNVALLLSGKIKKNPHEVAEVFSRDLENKNWSVSIAGPGFLNFTLSEKTLEKEFGEILKKKEKYATGKKKKGKIQVEFISANPTGPLTLANGRGGFLGDVLSNIFEKNGYTVEREYYVNDAGNQILTLGKSLLATQNIIPDQDSFYKGSYVKEWAQAHQAIVKKYQKSPMELGKAAAKDFLKNIRAAIEKKSGIHFDRYTSEDRDIHAKDLVKKTLAVFEKKGFVYEKEGARWLKTTEFGDDKDRVLITQDGYPTYFLADSGHYMETKLRKFDLKINIIGPDHYGYVKRIQAAAEIIGFRGSKIIVTQVIRLLRGEEEVKMSKRKGEFVMFEDLIDEVGRDAARYFFLEKSPDTHIDFDLNLAKERSVKNPVYYVQYAYVRAKSILAKTKKIKLDKNIPNHIEYLTTFEERALIKKLIQFPEIVEDTAKDFHVHRVIRYAQDLARLFNTFYEKNRVITEDPMLTNARIDLDRAVIQVLGLSLDLLGISKPKKM